MGASRVYNEAMVLMTLRTKGFESAFKAIRKGSKDSENALGKMAGGLATATEGSRTFTREAVEGALEMSTRLRHMTVVMGGTADHIEGLRHEQARMRVETGMNAEEVDRLRMGLVEIGEKSADVALRAAKVTTALELPTETTVGWFRMGKQMKMTGDETVEMMKQVGGLQTAMEVDPKDFFVQSAELAEAMQKRMLALGTVSKTGAKRFMLGAAGMSAALSKTGVGTAAANTAMMQYISTTAEGVHEMQKGLSGITSVEIPDMLKWSAIAQTDFTTAMNEMADSPDALMVKLAKITKIMKKEHPEAMKSWGMVVEQTVGDPAIALAITQQADSIIQGQKLAAGSADVLTAAFNRQLEAALQSPKALRAMRDQQIGVFKESIALNDVFRITNHLVEYQTKLIGWLNTEHDGLTGTMAAGIGNTIALGGVVGEAAEKFSDFTIKAAKTAEAIQDIRKAAPHVVKAILKAVPTFTKLGQSIMGIGKAAPLAVDAIDGMSVVATKAGPAVAGFGATLQTAVLPALLGLAAPLGILIAAVAAVAGVFYLAQKAAEASGDASLKAAEKQRKAADIVVKASTKAGKIDQMKLLSQRLHQLKTEEAGLTKQVQSGQMSFEESQLQRKALQGRITEQQKRLNMEITKQQGMKGVSTAGTAAGKPTGPTPVTPSSAFPPGGQMTRVAIQSLEEQRSQVGLLEQLVALMGGLPGAMTPATAGAGAGGGGVNVTIRPDSGKMQLHKMLEVDAKNTLGRAGYTQFGGRINSA